MKNNLLILVPTEKNKEKYGNKQFLLIYRNFRPDSEDFVSF